MSEPDDLEALAATAHGASVVIVGGGMAGLVAALECIKVGLRVTLLESADRLGGVVRSAELDGLTIDVGAESFATRGGTVRALVEECGLGAAITSPSGPGAWVAGLPGGGAAPLPKGSVLGIPDNPWAPEVRRIIGWGGAWRAYLDRLRPPLTIGHQRSLGALVRARMGDKVLDRLVAPVTGGVYSARPDDIDVDLAAPGLNAALTRTGSLSGAVAALRADRPTAPGAAVEGIVGGLTRLPDELSARLDELGVDLRTGVAASSVRRADAGWIVVTDDEDAPELTADAVIVAVGEAGARMLLAPVVPDLDDDAADAPVVEVITLVVSSDALDARPRGTGVLAVPGTRAAKALTHSTAKWEWLAQQAGPGRHVVRVSFGAQGEEPATTTLDDESATDLALSEASALLGVPLSRAALRAAHRERYAQAQPAATIGRAEQTAAARAAIRAVPGLAAVGAWLSGTGLAQVVPDARAEADRIRHLLLWGEELPGKGVLRP